MTDNRLKSLAERIERLMDERDGLGADIRDVFTEAKSAGYVPKVLRKAITRKRMDASKRDEEDAILELYEDALGPVGKAVAAVRAGSTWKEASEEHSVPRATLARAVRAVSIQQTDTADQITETAVLDTPPGGSSERADNEAASGAAPANTSAAPHGREDDASVPPADSIVPPTANPQMESVGSTSVTPAPSAGIEAGSHSDDPADEPAEWHRADVYQMDEALVPDETGAVGSLQGDRVANQPSHHVASQPQHVGCDYKMVGDGLEIPTFLRRVRA